MPELETDVHRTRAEPHAAEDQRPGRGAAAGESGRLVEDRVVAEVDEVAALPIAIAKHADARADVRLDGAAAAHGQEAHRRAEWHDAEIQVLLDLRAVRIREIAI